MLERLTVTDSSGAASYAFPEPFPFSNWTARRVLFLTNGQGLLYCDVDTRVSLVWYRFVGAAAPSSWSDATHVFRIFPAAEPTLGFNVDTDSDGNDLIRLAIDRTHTLERAVVDRQGTPVPLPACNLVLCDANQVELASIPATVSNNQYTVTIPRNLTTAEREIYFALRATSSDNRDYDRGTIQFTYVATT